MGIVIAGTSSYDCPFQTPLSTNLRKILLSSDDITSLIEATRKHSQNFLQNLSLPGFTWMDIQQVLVSVSNSARRTARYPFSQEISLSRITVGIQNKAKKLGHQTMNLLRWFSLAIRNKKQSFIQAFVNRATLLPVTGQLSTPQDGPGLQVRVRNLDTIRKQNADSARCICWILRNMTDPEAIDSAIRLAGDIRWFNGDSSYDPPFDLIVSTFEACFDTTNQMYPGMRDRAYFSARAILRINTDARVKSPEHASRYPIPPVPSGSVQPTDPDLCHIIRTLEYNFGNGQPTLHFPDPATHTPAHSLWMSNLFVELTRVGPNPTLNSHESYLNAAIANHKGMIVNILLMWYMFLGGRV